LNPAATTPTQLDMFKFFGCLVGFAIRTLSALPLHMAKTFWKQLLGDEITINDLNSIDTYSWQVIDDMKKQSVKLSDTEFRDQVD